MNTTHKQFASLLRRLRVTLKESYVVEIDGKDLEVLLAVLVHQARELQRLKKSAPKASGLLELPPVR